MVSTQEACDECAGRCLLVHHKGENSKSPISSFFKVMIGARFSEFVSLPPRFAATVRKLIGQETFFENSGGLQWKVKFSKVEGSLGFQEGWNVFAADNKLEFGDFVVFKYIEGSHFFVQIYDNSACEKPDSSVSRNQKKGTKTTEKTLTAKNGPHPSADKGTLKKQGSSRCVMPRPDSEVRQRHSKMKGLSKVKEVTEDTLNNEISTGDDDFTEEPFYATKKDVAGKSREFQSDEFDLSTLERLINNQCNGGSKKLTVGGKKYPKKVVASSKSSRAVGFYDKPPLAEEKIINASDDESWEESDDPEKRRKLQVAVSDKKLRNKEITKHGLSTSRCMNAKGSEENILKNPNEVRKGCQITEVLAPEPIGIERTLGSFFPSGCTYNIHRVVKPGALDIVCHPSTRYKVPCSTEAGGQPFLELPIPLPVSDEDEKSRKGSESRLVLLRDQCIRLWPVLYDASSPILMSGWEAFREANEIQPRDLCTFGIEDGANDIYEVCIDRN